MSQNNRLRIDEAGSIDNETLSNLSKFDAKLDGGFSNALTDAEYFKVMESIGIVPECEEEGAQSLSV